MWCLMSGLLVHFACRFCFAQGSVKEVEAIQHDLRYRLATVVPETQQTVLGTIAFKCVNAMSLILADNTHQFPARRNKHKLPRAKRVIGRMESGMATTAG